MMSLERSGWKRQVLHCAKSVLVVLAVPGLPAHGATIVVEAGCSLVDAIDAANSDAPAGGCSPGAGVDVIELTADVALKKADNGADGQNALPSITSEITLEGHAWKIFRDIVPSEAFPHFRFFHVGTGGILKLQNVELTGGIAFNLSDRDRSRGGAIFNRGTLVVADSTISNNRAWVVQPQAFVILAEGGGIYNLGDTLITESTVSSNRADAVIEASGRAEARGGAIFNGPDAQLTIESSTLLGNTSHAEGFGSDAAKSFGGAIFSDQDSTLDLRATRVEQNLAEGEDLWDQHPWAFGGAIAVTGAVVHVIDSEVVDNLAVAFFGRAQGGGLSCDRDGAIEIRNSTFENNRADVGPTCGTAKGGGAWADCPLAVRESAFIANTAIAGDWAAGGAIGTGSRSLEVTNSTLSGNSAVGVGAATPCPRNFPAGGGAVNNRGSVDVRIRHTTVANNSAIGPLLMGGGLLNDREMSIENSIIDGNPGGNCVGPITDLGNNFGCVPGAPVITGLRLLADNGGPTLTHALDPTSNAVDQAGDCGLSRDQRLIARPPPCDSGAYEHNPCLIDDAFEAIGSGGTDDTCYGSRLELGLVESRLHCDEDWLSVSASPGRTYEIKTINLVGGADTVLEAAQFCGPILASDDDEGAGPGSRLVFQSSLGGFLDVRVTEKHNSYSPGEGYDVVAHCIGGCDCEPPEGPDLLLANDSIATTLTYEACGTINLMNFIVEPLGDVTLRAGASVVIQDGSEIGGALTVEIDPSLLPPV